MAVPTISSFSPTSGPAGGRNLVTISGTNFLVPAAPATTGAIQAAAPRTVRVKFAAEEASTVDVVSSTTLRIQAPAYRGDPDAGNHVAVAIEVTNLDSAGNPIPGETVTLAAAYTYTRASLRPPAVTPLLVTTTGELIFALRRQIHPNVFPATHTDFGEVGAVQIAPARLPSLFLTGPDVDQDFIRNSIEREDHRSVQTGSLVDRYLPMITLSLHFGIAGLSDNSQEILALAQALEEFAIRTPFLYVPKNPIDAAQGQHRFELELVEEPKFSIVASRSNLRSFTASLAISDVPVELPEVFDRHEIVTRVENQIQQLPSTISELFPIDF